LGGQHKVDFLKFSGHALGQMFARLISVDEVRIVVEQGEVIASYPDDSPYPSELRLGFAGERALHVVFAYDEVLRTAYVVTAYVPDPKIWSEDLRSRRKQ